MDVSDLLARMQAQREFWVDLPGGKRLQLRRPHKVDMPKLTGGVQLDHVVDASVGWSGFTEADLLGAGIGGSDEQPFHTELWRAYAADNIDALQTAVAGFAEHISQYLSKGADTEKN